MQTIKDITQNAILRISDDKTLQLIELYKKEECLWNTHTAVYKNRFKRQEAAERIAKALDIKHFNARHVIIKFKNLRNSYCQELKKIAATAANGEGNTYKPKVFWFNTMDSFIRPHLNQTRELKLKMDNRTSSVGDDQSSVFIKKEPEAEKWVQMTDPEDVIVPDTIKEEPEAQEWVQMTNPEDVIVPDTSKSRDNFSGSEYEESLECGLAKPLGHNEFGKKRKFDDLHNESLAVTLRDINTQLHVLTNQRDDCFDSFGKYISSMLRSMPMQKALELQPKIVALITSVGISNNEGRISQSHENCS
ncbi:unnamed protein product [Parnassius apollo]|uniref:(apollo) hypothetical protein n=1 Tax=Parnassius apollo TaxID=110799 RepID=A0A8S3W6Y7_PARAO|nr:unnamed protein product [Parnassius apollo]